MQSKTANIPTRKLLTISKIYTAEEGMHQTSLQLDNPLNKQRLLHLQERHNTCTNVTADV